MEERSEQLPLHCMVVSPQGWEKVTHPLWAARRTGRAPAQLCALGAAALAPRRVCTCVCLGLWDVLDPLAQSSPVVVLRCWAHWSWAVAGAQLGGLQPPRCSKDQVPCSRQPHPCFHTFSQHGHILQRPGAVSPGTEAQQRAGLPTSHCPGQALWLCRSGCDCAATVGEACRESCSFSYASGTAPLPLCFHLTTTSRTKWLSDLIFYLN